MSVKKKAKCDKLHEAEVRENAWREKLEETIDGRHRGIEQAIMNFLIREGFQEAAEKFEMEGQATPMVPIKSIGPRASILEAMRAGRILEAIEKVNVIHPKLLEEDRDLSFQLHLQHLIEIIRQEDVDGALQFAQEHLAPKSKDSAMYLQEQERVLALLAFQQPETSPFSDLLEISHRDNVAELLNNAILLCESIGSESLNLAMPLKFVMWAQHELDGKNVDYVKMTDFEKATFEAPK